ncbi:MAG: 50S ribosomal protein L10 [Acholeplasmataceae bacterium]
MERVSIKKKASEVESLAAKFSEALTVITFEYKGLTVEKFTELRTSLHKEGINVKVYKNNITKRAAQKAGYGDIVESLTGPLAVIISNDKIVDPAKILSDFAKQNKIVSINSGIIEGKVVPKETIIEIASLPNRETLLTQLTAGLLMPVQQIAIGLNMLAEAQE